VNIQEANRAMQTSESPGRPSPEQAAQAFLSEHHPRASLLFLAGSVRRGEATAHSDLDLVVIYPELPQAWRESRHFAGWPIEAFVHDPETLHYFFQQVDGPSGVPSLMQMVTEGLALPSPSALSEQLRHLAHRVLAQGPPPWRQAELDASRYAISDSLDDLLAPRNPAELRASATRLYAQVSSHFLRAQGHWDATGKAIPRQLQKHDPAFAERFEAAFAEVFERQQTEAVKHLCQDLLEPFGGLLFAGYQCQAPAEWRLPWPVES